MDPDSDHHLSNFIFRVGGEQGHSSLLEKFQTILERMGIALDFGDNTTASIADASSVESDKQSVSELLTASPHGIKAPIPELSQAFDTGQHPPFHPASLRSHVPASRIIASTATDIANPHLLSEFEERYYQPGPIQLIRPPEFLRPSDLPDNANITPDHEDSQDQPLPAALRRSLMVSLLERWRKSTEKAISELPKKELSAQREIVDEVPPTEAQSSHGVSPRPIQLLQHKREPSATERVEPTSSFSRRPETPSEEDGAILLRAMRARELHVASKVFNHWAERAATRIEREAVARRHMIRFRCFQGWCKTPSSTMPVASHLRTLTAVQKLQRAVHAQEEQLHTASAAIAQSHRLEKIHAVLSTWQCKNREQLALADAALRTKNSVRSWWQNQAARASNSRFAATISYCLFSSGRAIDQWRRSVYISRESMSGAMASSAQHQLCSGAVKWRYQTCVSHQSQYLRHTRDLAIARHYLNIWNLETRAQAFKGRGEYIAALQAISVWEQVSHRFYRSSEAAQAEHRSHSTKRVLGSMERRLEGSSQLMHFAQRAQLYISGNRLINAFKRAFEDQLRRQKEDIRRQLMQRYKEASALRKKQLFDSALNRWRSFTHQQDELIEADILHAAHTSDRKTSLALEKWCLFDKELASEEAAAAQRPVSSYLSAWSQQMAQSEAQRAQAQTVHTGTRYHRGLRAWTKSNLQGSGQQYTADRAQQRSNMGHRSKAFKRWRLLVAPPQGLDYNTGYDLPVPQSEPPLFRQSWRARLNNFGSSTTSQGSVRYVPLETPTKWTGVAAPKTAPRLVNPTDSLDRASPKLSASISASRSASSLLPVPSHDSPSLFLRGRTMNRTNNTPQSTRFRGPTTEQDIYALTPAPQRNIQDGRDAPGIKLGRTPAAFANYKSSTLSRTPQNASRSPGSPSNTPRPVY